MSSNLAITKRQIKRFYDRVKFPGCYDELSVYNRDVRNIFIEFIRSNLRNNIEVLDIGCGTGLVTNALAPGFRSNFTAVDMSRSIMHGITYAQKHKIHNVEWVQKDFLDFETNKTYDVIICQGVLHHMPDYVAAAQKILNLLKPNGTLLLGVYHPLGKILQKLLVTKYHSQILEQDQTNHPFELTFAEYQVKKLFYPLKVQSKCPDFVHMICNPSNGGLIIYRMTRNDI